MAQHLKLIALLIFTLSASYTSAQSLRKLLERPYGIIESKWEKDAQVDNPFKSASSYTFYRGKFPKDFNIQTPYALPVKNNQKTDCITLFDVKIQGLEWFTRIGFPGCLLIVLYG